MHQRIPLPTALLLSATVFVAATVAGLAASLWRLANASQVQHEQLLSQQREFFKQSLAEQTRLATNAGLLTNAELCPVRFRLRNFEGHSTPCHPIMARLEAIATPGGLPVQTVPAHAGMIDLGLNPPGRYRLVACMADDMHMEYEFDVLPGVPVDRLVRVPVRSAGGEVYQQVSIDWPAELQALPIVALCRIEPAAAVSGDWHWQPHDEWRAVYVVVCNSDFGYEVDEAVLEAVASVDAAVFPADEAVVPYHYCQVTEMTFLAAPSNTSCTSAMENLGTVAFTDVADDIGSLVETREPGWRSTGRPCFKRRTRTSRISLPDAVVTELMERINRCGCGGKVLARTSSS